MPSGKALRRRLPQGEAMTETKRLRQIWRQLRSRDSMRGFDMDYKFLRSCVHYSTVLNDASSKVSQD